MGKNVRRGMVAGAVVLAVAFPAGAYAYPGGDWSPGAGDCEMSEEVRAAFEDDAELQALREARQADAEQFRAEHRATRDPDGRDARQAEAVQHREQCREQVEAQLADNPEALKWFQENGAGQNARQGEGAGAGAQAGQRAGDGVRQGGRAMMQERLAG